MTPVAAAGPQSVAGAAIRRVVVSWGLGYLINRPGRCFMVPSCSRVSLDGMDFVSAVAGA